MTALVLQFVRMTDRPNRIYELRRARGLSQQDLADNLNCSKMQVSGMERGKRALTIEWMRRIAAVFGVTAAEILTEKDNGLFLDEDERQLIETYRSADPEQRQQIMRVTEVMVPFRHRAA